MIVRRVKAGLAARKAKGLRLGRVPLTMCLLRFPIQQLPPDEPHNGCAESYVEELDPEDSSFRVSIGIWKAGCPNQSDKQSLIHSDPYKSAQQKIANPLYDSHVEDTPYGPGFSVRPLPLRLKAPTTPLP